MIYYRGGYRYQLAETYVVQTNLRPKKDIKTHFILLTTGGELTIIGDYAWDGPSGAIHTDNFIKPSCAHDACYQLMRMELLPTTMREEIDDLMMDLLRENKMSKLRMWWVRKGVRKLAEGAADHRNIKDEMTTQ